MTVKQHIADVLERAAKTFLEALLPVWAATNFSFGKDALLSAGAAGVSAVWNVALKLEAAHQNATVTTYTPVVVTPDPVVASDLPVGP